MTLIAVLIPPGHRSRNLSRYDKDGNLSCEITSQTRYCAIRMLTTAGMQRDNDVTVDCVSEVDYVPFSN